MTRHTTTILVAGFMAFLAILVPVIAAEPQPKAGNDDAAQLKAAQEERIKLLSDLEKQLEQGYRAGTVPLYFLAAADKDLCNAQLDFCDEPSKRVAVLEKCLETADNLVKVAIARFKAGTVIEADVQTAKSHYLEIKIQLLRERIKSKARQGRTSQSDGKMGGDDAAQLKAAQEERSVLLGSVENAHFARYEAHLGEFYPVIAAKKDLCKAQLDLYDEPSKRLSLLENELKTADDLVRIADAKVKADTAAEKDLRKAQLDVLRIEVATAKAAIAAEKNLRKAQPSKRLASLEKELKTAEDRVRIAEAKVKEEIVPESDAQSAKAYYLDVKIQLLQERIKSKARQGRTGG